MKTAMPTRRLLISGAAALAASAALGQGRPAAQIPKPGEDGLYHFDWYLESFLDLSEDIESAAKNGKRLAVLWSQRGCIYCKRLAEEYFTAPEITNYIRANFEILHLDLFGAKEVTDFDGAKLREKALAQSYGVRLTPTFQFFPESTAGLGKLEPAKRESVRMQGLLEPAQFLAMFRYVREKGYEKSGFNEWFRANS